VAKKKGYALADAALHVVVLKDAGIIRINFSDVFATTRIESSGDFAGQHFFGESNREPQQLRISFSYRFGSAKIKQARQRKTGIEDEAGRTQ
jgi:iron complex outermembrane receptor protein